VDIYQELGVKKYINAHDTFTVYGGSRMAAETLEAMRQAAQYFVDLPELQNKIGDKIAEMTQNEAAYITNGASASIQLAVAVCITGGDMFIYSRLPDPSSVHNEIVVMRCQRNAYDAAIRPAGAKMVEIGDADETLEYELCGVLSEKTAAILYFASSLYAKAALPLAQVIKIAKEKGVPVIVDAAAQLPPVENLWKFTRMGADMVLFSGGKTLCGPQASGLIVGSREMIEKCRHLGSPQHGICRSSKVGREEMIGLYTAVKRYLALNHEQNYQRLLNIVRTINSALERTGAFQTYVLDHGPVGQAYPRSLGIVTGGFSAEKLADLLREHNPGIYIGIDTEHKNAIYISPLNLKDDEVETVISVLVESVNKLIKIS